jgi:hypothetical protein
VPARDTAAAGRTADGRPGARGAAAAGGAGRGTRARWPADGGAQLGALAAAGGRGAPPAVRLSVVGGLGNSASRSARRASTRRQSALVLGILKLWEDGQVQTLKNEGKSTGFKIQGSAIAPFLKNCKSPFLPSLITCLPLGENRRAVVTGA